MKKALILSILTVAVFFEIASASKKVMKKSSQPQTKKTRKELEQEKEALKLKIEMLSDEISELEQELKSKKASSKLSVKAKKAIIDLKIKKITRIGLIARLSVILSELKKI